MAVVLKLSISGSGINDATSYSTGQAILRHVRYVVNLRINLLRFLLIPYFTNQEMIGCDSSLQNCVSYLGDYYQCDSQVHNGGTQGGPEDAYICNCVSQIIDAPMSGGGYTFQGSVPRSGGCGLPMLAPAAASSSSLSTSSSTTSR